MGEEWPGGLMGLCLVHGLACPGEEGHLSWPASQGGLLRRTGWPRQGGSEMLAAASRGSLVVSIGKETTDMPATTFLRWEMPSALEA